MTVADFCYYTFNVQVRNTFSVFSCVFVDVRYSGIGSEKEPRETQRKESARGQWTKCYYHAKNNCNHPLNISHSPNRANRRSTIGIHAYSIQYE